MNIDLRDSYGLVRTAGGYAHAYRGELELIVRDVRGNELSRQRESNIIKIFFKEAISHRLASGRVWDPQAAGGAGDWVAHSLPLDDYAARYICFGASFDANGVPLDSTDTRYYTPDPVSGGYITRQLGIGAEYDGGLINAIPLSSPRIPLKRVERIYFESSYQPAGSPLLDQDVRAINNILVLETTLRKDEYNGFGATDSDFFTITEVALVAARELPPAQGSCECDPRILFLEGNGDYSINANANGTATVSIDPDVDNTLLNVIKEGDQVKLVARGAPRQGQPADELGQVSPYYLVTSKAPGGRDIVLDRAPVYSTNVPISGEVGVLKDGFRVVAHRLLKSPVKKSLSYEITVRWRIVLN